MFPAAIIAAASVATTPLDGSLMRWPTVCGDTVVFTYAGDLWTCSLSGGIARRLTSFPGLESRARFSPDGKTIAFTGGIDGGSDVFTIPAEGGEPVRVTYDPAPDNVLGWTPDGKIAYSSGTGSLFTGRMWVVDPKGGQPVQTRLMEITDGSFSPDGKTVAFTRMGSHTFNWRKYRGGTQGRISFFSLQNNAYSEIPSGHEQSYHPMWVGEDVYYISDKDGKAINLYKYSTKSKKVEQLTKNPDGDIRWPSTDGKVILWERLGRVEVYTISTGKVASFAPSVISDNRSLRPRYRSFANQITGMSLSPSGKRIAVEARGDIYSLPASNGETRALTTGQRSREKDPQWSPDGQSVAFLSDRSGEWQIMVEPQMGGEAKAVSLTGEPKIRSFGYSATGRYFSFTTFDASLYVVPVEGGAPRKVAQDAYGSEPSYDWSPDDSYIAFTESAPNMMSRICVYETATGKVTPVTPGILGDSSPSFDLSGKYLYFISNRTLGMAESVFEGPNIGQQDTARVYMLPLTAGGPDPLKAPDDEEPVKSADKAPGDKPAGEKAPGGPGAPGGGEGPKGPVTKIDFERIMNRAVPLPWPAGSYPFVLGGRDSVFTWTDGSLVQFSLASRQAVPIISGATGFSFNQTRTKAAYRAGSLIGIIDVRPGSQIGSGRVDTSGVAAMWNPRDEYQQMFWEVWRWERDVFYDPNMVGLNWKAVGDKYAAILPEVGDRSDLNYLFGQLIGELGTGHAYVSGGELEGVPAPPVGMLGADLEVEGNSVKIAKVYEGFSDAPEAKGPLLGKGVKDGEYLVEINGQPVTAQTSVSSMLVNKAGRPVTITVNDRPSAIGARKIEVIPTYSEGQLRYQTWVEERRKMVDELSGGRIGYMHVPNTSVQGIVGFVKGFYSQSDKEAWLIDERFNGGGYIPTFFLEALQRTVDAAFKGRYGKPFPLPSQSLIGPKAMLINNYAGSGGDMFPWLFKDREAGPLIGTRTWGGLVGISGGAPLVDGGSVTAPGFGIFDPNRREWIAENKGVTPDMEVDNDPGRQAVNDDAQLKKAVQYLLDELKKGKGRKPVEHPKFPRRDP